MPDHDMTKFIIMGVAGSGKSSVGSALARELGAVFIDGDDMHPKENIAKMSSGRPLTDDDRNPWLQNIGMALNSNIGTVVIACSALKKSIEISSGKLQDRQSCSYISRALSN